MDSSSGTLRIGEWRAVPSSCELIGPNGTERLEPKVMDLLVLLASRPGETFSKDDIMARLWPNVVVGDDTLARAVSRLRRSLGDETKTPRYIETLPKRGYRLIAEVSAVDGNAMAPATTEANVQFRPYMAAGAAAAIVLLLTAILFLVPSNNQPESSRQHLVDRANDFYFQYRRADNEAAIQLFERILLEDPDYAPALAGLANALVQKVIRWTEEPGAKELTKLGDALKSGRTKTEAARRLLLRAQTYAARAVSVAPTDPDAHKALGFVQGAHSEFAAAIASYKKAVALDANAWGPLINIGDVLEISGKPLEAVPYFEAAYAAMTRVYEAQSVRVRPWHAELGVAIGERYNINGDTSAAEAWFRRVLVYAPLHQGATSRLARLLREVQRGEEAEALCANLARSAGPAVTCGIEVQ